MEQEKDYMFFDVDFYFANIIVPQSNFEFRCAAI